MKTKNMAFFAVLTTVLFSGIVSAITPGLPNQIFGTVSINGAPAPDGTIVSARINGVEVKNIPTTNGKYGYAPGIFYVDDFDHNREGSIINFFVNGVDTGANTYFANGKSTELNLAIAVAVPAPQYRSSGGGGSYTPINNSNTTNTTVAYTPTGPCTERWICDAWSEGCNGGVQKRTCSDVNKCGTIDDLPMITQPCSIDEAASDSLNASKRQLLESGGLSGITGRMFSFVSSSAGYLVVLIILVGLLAYYRSSKKSEYNIKPVKRRL